MSFELDYDESIHLDAEDLTEGGLGKAYESLLPKLSEYVAEPERIDESMDDEGWRYAVQCAGKEYVVYTPETAELSGWGRAAYVLFTIVNEQLVNTGYRLFALYGGNDLQGMFLTPDQAVAARKKLRNKSDWPYLPEDKEPWFGQYH